MCYNCKSLAGATLWHRCMYIRTLIMIRSRMQTGGVIVYVVSTYYGRSVSYYDKMSASISIKKRAKPFDIIFVAYSMHYQNRANCSY